MEIIYLIIASLISIFALIIVFKIVNFTFRGIWQLIKYIFVAIKLLLGLCFRLFPFFFLGLITVIMAENLVYGMRIFLLISFILLILMSILWRKKFYHLFYGNLAIFINLGMIYWGVIQFYNEQIFLLLIFLVSINISTIIFYGYDKLIAVTKFLSIARVPEDILHWHSFLLGTLGAFLSQRIFRHKFKKPEFMVIFYSTLIAQLILFIIAIVLIIL